MTISASHPCCIDYGTFFVKVPMAMLWQIATSRVQIGVPSSDWHDHNGVLHQHIGREVVGVWNWASQTEWASIAKETWQIWKATKEYLNQRGTKIRVFRVPFRAPFLPPFSTHFSPLFPLQAVFTLPPLPPSSPPLFPPLFWLPENSDVGTPLI